MNFVQFIFQPNKCTIYTFTNNILYIVSTPTCFSANASSSGSLNLVLAKVVRSRVRSPLVSLSFFIDSPSGRTMALGSTQPLNRN